MIKVVHAQWAGDSKVTLSFSDGSDGVYDFGSLLSKDTALTQPLRNAEMFKRFFLNWEPCAGLTAWSLARQNCIANWQHLDHFYIPRKPLELNSVPREGF